ncbi:ABC-2 family transporter protein [Paenibacillus sophorae]|uniref:ABC-2 family transporter protein n=1 Tax=Paenibacillus sophorae TaxID=1333845 RepID=A0A1H8FK19_9BACL|nr:ABC-2 transporter permease [Paenibacillus sophorae]QWU13894.1 ABC-2 transporter permease [Paenibacillus sophorae]SEN31992.1 ABC-2 family transporter protein [Paenibacillus sophorae]
MSNLVSLIRKDFMLSRNYLLFMVPYLIVLSIMNTNAAQFGVSLIVIFSSMTMLLTSCLQDIRNVNIRFSLSLPVHRRMIVVSKYVSVLPFLLIGVAIVLVLSLVLQQLGYDILNMNWRELGVSILSVPLMASIYLPLYYWLGPKGAQYVNTVFFLAIFFGMMNQGDIVNSIPGMKNFILDNADMGLEKWLVGGAVYILFVAASYLVSLRLFSSRDL